MATYSRAERLAAIQKAGFANPLTALAVSLAEFGENRDINSQSQSGVADPSSPNGREQSYGPWQIHLDFWGKPNSLFPAGITQACAMDLTCSTDAAAKISRGGTNFGDWSAFTNGSYARFLPELKGLLPATGGGDFGIDPDLLARIRQRLGQLLVLHNKGGISEGGIATTLQQEFPQVSNATLQAIVGHAGTSAVTNIDNTPVLGGAATTVRKTAESADAFRAWVESIVAPNNLWRAGFLVLGAALIFFGARLYLSPDRSEVGREVVA